MSMKISALISALLVICMMLTTGCVNINIYRGGEDTQGSGKLEIPPAETIGVTENKGTEAEPTIDGTSEATEESAPESSATVTEEETTAVEETSETEETTTVETETAAPETTVSTVGEGSAIDENIPSYQLWSEYSEMKDGSWKLPDLEDLLDTTWAVEEVTDSGDLHSYEVTFRGGGADVRWNNDGEDHEYIAAFYMLTYDEGVAIIELDLGGLAGIQKFAVLMSTEGDLLYTSANVVEGETLLCGSSVSSRTLERIYG